MALNVHLCRLMALKTKYRPFRIPECAFILPNLANSVRICLKILHSKNTTSQPLGRGTSPAPPLALRMDQAGSSSQAGIGGPDHPLEANAQERVRQRGPRT